VPYLHYLQAPALSPLLLLFLLFILYMFPAASHFSLSIRFLSLLPLSLFAVAVLFYSLLAPGTFIGLTRFPLWPSTAAVVASVSLNRTTTVSLSLAASNVHTLAGVVSVSL
jgi:hypothetical protein